MRSHLNELRGYISLHAYENAILVPFGYSYAAKPSNFDELFSTAKQMTQSMNSVYGNNYTVIKSSSLCKSKTLRKLLCYHACFVADPASGCSDDYAKSLGVRYVYTIELTTGFYQGNYVGFETPQQMIAPTGDEVRAGVVRLLQIIASQP
jgi:carboxypeptidase A3